jgi:manganese/iron transport system substrate-binding protein
MQSYFLPRGQLFGNFDRQKVALEKCHWTAFVIIIIIRLLSSLPMSRSFLSRWSFALFLLWGNLGCSQTPGSSNAPIGTSPAATPSSTKPQVVATTDVLCDLTKQIARDTVNLQCLIAAGTDPHGYQVTPQNRQAIEQADLVFYAGYDFEPTLIKVIKSTKTKAPKIAVSEVAVPKPIAAPGEESSDHQSGGHAHASDQDPHVWHNAQNGIKMAQTIQAELSQLLPNNRSIYTQNSQTLTGQLQTIDGWIKAQIATIPARQRQLVTTHDALAYYGQAYGLPIAGALQGLSTDEKPTAQRLKSLVTQIKKTGVTTLFIEATASPKLLEAIAQDAGVKISNQPLLADGLGAAGSNGDSYPKMLIANTQAIVTGLGGQYQPPTP